MHALIAVNRKMVKFLLLPFFLATSLIFGSVVDDGLKQVSMHDKACMSAFFDDAIVDPKN